MHIFSKLIFGWHASEMQLKKQEMIIHIKLNAKKLGYELLSAFIEAIDRTSQLKQRRYNQILIKFS